MTLGRSRSKVRYPRGGALRTLAVAGLLLALLVPSEVWAQRSGNEPAGTGDDRYVALVLGNGRFEGPLQVMQSAADVVAIAAQLRPRGFQIVSLATNGGCADGPPQLDVARETMQALVACFTDAAQGARQALLYFSGHSVRLDNRSYLVPTGATLTSPLAQSQLVELQPILNALEKSKPGLAIIVLDAARSTMKHLAEAPGLNRVEVTATPRIVAYSGPVAAWADDPAIPRRVRRNPKAEASGGELVDAATIANALSPYTRRLVQLLDDDLDLRSLGQPGVDVATLLRKASEFSGAAAGLGGELMIENITTAGMLGRAPRIGNSACEIISWRAENLGRCIEIATAYENCGKDSGMRQRLENDCPADWAMLAQYSLRSALVGAMRAKKCDAFKKVVSQFESEPSISKLAEFAEVRSLAQYTCAIEAKETLKSEIAAVLAAPTCLQAQRLLVGNRDALEADARGKLEKLSKDLCCPEYGLGKECLTRKVAIGRVVAKLEEKGCSMGRTPEAKVARAMHIMELVNSEGGFGVDFKVNRVVLDQVWARIEKLQKDECSCQKNEMLLNSGACGTAKQGKR